tara:strand:+ start:233 stop:394 length:162 start_codon:yes stop_codon:yes gene_type:complete
MKAVDKIKVEDGAVHILLKKKGEPVAGIYVEGKKEFVSPELSKKEKANDISAE